MAEEEGISIPVEYETDSAVSHLEDLRASIIDQTKALADQIKTTEDAVRILKELDDGSAESASSIARMEAKVKSLGDEYAKLAPDIDKANTALMNQIRFNEQVASMHERAAEAAKRQGEEENAMWFEMMKGEAVFELLKKGAEMFKEALEEGIQKAFEYDAMVSRLQYSSKLTGTSFEEMKKQAEEVGNSLLDEGEKLKMVNQLMISGFPKDKITEFINAIANISAVTKEAGQTTGQAMQQIIDGYTKGRISVIQLERTFPGMTDAFEKAHLKISELKGGTKQAAAQMLFFSEVLKDNEAAADGLADHLKTPAGQMEQWQKTVEGLKEELGKGFVEGITSATGGTQQFTEILQGFLPVAKEVGEVLGKIATGLVAAFGDGTQVLADQLGNLLTMLDEANLNKLSKLALLLNPASAVMGLASGSLFATDALHALGMGSDSTGVGGAVGSNKPNVPSLVSGTGHATNNEAEEARKKALALAAAADAAALRSQYEKDEAEHLAKMTEFWKKYEENKTKMEQEAALKMAEIGMSEEERKRAQIQHQQDMIAQYEHDAGEAAMRMNVAEQEMLAAQQSGDKSALAAKKQLLSQATADYIRAMGDQANAQKSALDLTVNYQKEAQDKIDAIVKAGNERQRQWYMETAEIVKQAVAMTAEQINQQAYKDAGVTGAQLSRMPQNSVAQIEDVEMVNQKIEAIKKLEAHIRELQKVQGVGREQAEKEIAQDKILIQLYGLEIAAIVQKTSALAKMQQVAGGLGDVLGQIGGFLGGKTGGVMGAIGGGLSSFSNADIGSTNAFGTEMTGMLAGITAVAQGAQMLGQVIGGKTGGVISSIGQFAATGAMFGPWGAAVGAAIGAVVGLLKAFSHDWMKDTNEVLKQFGLMGGLSDDLTKKLADLAKQMHDAGSAVVVGLGAIMNEKGLTKDNFAFYVNTLMYGFDAMKDGKITAEQLGKTFQDVFPQMLSAAMEWGGPYIQMLDQVMQKMKETGVGLDILKDAMKQIKDAIKAIKDQALQDLLGHMSELGAQFKTMMDKLKASAMTHAGATDKNWMTFLDDKQLNQAKHRFEQMQMYAVQTFTAMRAQGMSMYEIFQKLGPVWDQITEAAKQMGYKTSKQFQNFDWIMEQIKKHAAQFAHLDLTSKITEDLARLGAATQQNMNMLMGSTVAMFTKLSGMVWDTQKKMFTGSTEHAKASIQAVLPYLIQILGLHNQLGLAISAQDQALIDLAKSYGLLPQNTSQVGLDPTVAALQKMLDVLILIAKVLGVANDELDKLTNHHGGGPAGTENYGGGAGSAPMPQTPGTTQAAQTPGSQQAQTPGSTTTNNASITNNYYISVPNQRVFQGMIERNSRDKRSGLTLRDPK